MNYISQAYPLALWDRISARLAASLKQKKASMTSRLRSISANTDTEAKVLAVARADRDAIHIALGQNYDLLVLTHLIEVQLTNAKVSAGIPEMDARISTFGRVIAMYEAVTQNLPSRADRERELRTYSEEFRLLKTAGQGDQINQDRQRIREGVVEIPVLGHEDVEEIIAQINNITTELDTLVISRHMVLTQTLLSVSLPENLYQHLAAFGLAFYEEIPEPVPQEPDQPVDSGEATSETPQ